MGFFSSNFDRPLPLKTISVQSNILQLFKGGHHFLGGFRDKILFYILIYLNCHVLPSFDDKEGRRGGVPSPPPAEYAPDSVHTSRPYPSRGLTRKITFLHIQQLFQN